MQATTRSPRRSSAAASSTGSRRPSTGAGRLSAPPRGADRLRPWLRRAREPLDGRGGLGRRQPKPREQPPARSGPRPRPAGSPIRRSSSSRDTAAPGCVRGWVDRTRGATPEDAAAEENQVDYVREATAVGARAPRPPLRSAHSRRARPCGGRRARPLPGARRCAPGRAGARGGAEPVTGAGRQSSSWQEARSSSRESRSIVRDALDRHGNMACYGMTPCQHSCVRQHLWPLSAGLRLIIRRLDGPSSVQDDPVGRMRPRQTIDPAPVRLGPRATRIVQPSAKQQFCRAGAGTAAGPRVRHHEPGTGRAPLPRPASAAAPRSTAPPDAVPPACARRAGRS